jgi:TPR repeat protein
MAAEHGHARAQLQLGHMFGEGIGVEQDRAEAAKWYRMAAGHGSKEAITRLRYVEAKIRQNFQTCLSLLALGLAGLFAAVLVAVVEPKLTRTIPPGEVELVRRDMRKFLFTFLGQLGLVAAYCLYYGASLFDPRSGRTDLPNSPEYARLRLQVDYNGALQSFDYVIGCHLHSTLGASTGTPRPVAYAPDIFARRLPDGKALAIAAPSVCEIEIDPLTGTDIVPLMVVYDDADTLASGSAYATLDAFDSPLSELTFHGAALFPAAKEEYDDFRSNGEKNLVTPEHYFSANLNYGARDSCGIREINKPMAASCLAFARFEVPAAAREAVTRAWLRHGRPRFWMQTSDDIKTNGDLTFKLHMPENALSRLGERGLRRNPPYPPVFPIRMAFDDISRILARSDERLPVYIMEMPYAATDFLGGKTRGFAWCRSFDDQSWIRAGLTRVKGLSPPVVIDENGAAQAIAGSGVPELSSGIHHVSRLYGYFENDEYYYSRATIGLRRMNGEP